MNNQILEKLEEKFVFKTSHIFFLVLVGAALLVMVGSTLIFLWGITPSLKPGVEKAEYPAAVAVTADEVSRLIPVKVTPGGKTTVATVTPGRAGKTSKKITEVTPPAVVDSTKIAYGQAIDSMKTLLPPKKYLWGNKGHYENSYYSGRRWVVERYGIQAKLNAVFRAIKVGSFTGKTELINTYLSILNRFNEKNRYGTLKSMLLFPGDNLSSTKENIRLLEQSIDLFPSEKTGYLYKLAQFGKKNPRDGHAFIGFIIQVMPKFDKTQREKVLDKMITGYYKRYDNIARQKEATAMFLPLLPKFDTNSQATALAAFYNLYDRKNRERRYGVERIDSQYEQDQRRAEMVLQEKKVAKSGYRYNGLIGLAGAIVFIALIALVLSLLSIQRNIRELKMMATPKVIEEKLV